MKRVLLTIAVIFATFSVFAQETTKGTVMSKANKVDYGFTYGYGADYLHHFGLGVLDFNLNNSNLRFRGLAGLMEVKEGVCPAAGIDAQYLFKTIGNLYIYPTAGIYGEYHTSDVWKVEEDSDYGIGAEVGAGAEYQFNPHFGLFVEGRQQFLYNCVDRPEANIGVIFHFGQGARAKAVAAAAAAAEAERLAAEAAAAEKAAAEKAAAEKAAAEAAAAKAAAEKAEAERLAAEKAAAEAARAEARATTENVFFKIGKWNIRKSEEQKVANIVDIMNQYPEATVIVSGYADEETGTAKGNLELSKKRSETVKQALVDAGIASERITTAFYGDTVQPYEVNEQNRVAVIVTK